MINRVDIPVRDVLQIAVGGAYATFVTAVVYFVATDQHLFSEDGTLYASVLSLVLGLAARVARVHATVWPWRPKWADGLKGIQEGLKTLGGDESLGTDELARPIYKIWTETFADESVRGYVHYTTGLFYMLAPISLASGMGAILVLAIFVGRAVVFAQADQWPALFTFPHASLLPLAIAWVFMAYLCYLQSLKDWKSVVKTGIIAMHTEAGAQQVRQLARAAARAQGRPTDHEFIEETVKSVVGAFRPDLADTVESVDVHPTVSQYDLRDDTHYQVVPLTVVTSAPEEANGRDNLYSGPLQQKIEEHVQTPVARRLNVDRVRLQIMGTEPSSAGECPAHTNKEFAPITLNEAIRLKIIRNGGAVHECCSEYGLSHVLLRNGRIVGPSPGLAHVLRELLKRVPPDGSVYDPFAGTNLAAAVCNRVSRTIAVVANDRMDLNGNETGSDAFHDRPKQKFDVVVIDPFYEDVLPYLRRVVPKLRYQYLVVQSGDECDATWNSAVAQVLVGLGTVAGGFDHIRTCGKKIYVVQNGPR